MYNTFSHGICMPHIAMKKAVLVRYFRNRSCLITWFNYEEVIILASITCRVAWWFRIREKKRQHPREGHVVWYLSHVIGHMIFHVMVGVIRVYRAAFIACWINIIHLGNIKYTKLLFCVYFMYLYLGKKCKILNHRRNLKSHEVF